MSQSPSSRRNRPENTVEQLLRLRLEPTVDWRSPNALKRSSFTMMYTTPLVEPEFLRFVHGRKQWLCWIKLSTTVLMNILIAATLPLHGYELFYLVCCTLILTVAFFSEWFMIWFVDNSAELPLDTMRTFARMFEIAVTVGCVMLVILHSVLLFSSSHHCEEYDKRRYGVDQELTCTSAISWLLMMIFLTVLLLEKPRMAISIPIQMASFLLFNVLFGIVVQTPHYTLHVVTMACVVVFCAWLKIHQEIRHRDQFEALVAACIAMDHFSKRRDKLKNYVGHLVPRLIRNKLLEGSTSMDLCEDASCVLLDISSVDRRLDNLATIDADSFTVLMRLDRVFTGLCEKFGVHRIVIFGDTFCATCNLLAKADDHASRCILFASGATDAGRRLAPGYSIRSSVHSGRLIGITVSTSFVHYAIFGEAFLGAALLLTEGRAVISVSQVTRAAVDHNSSFIMTPTFRSVELQSGNITKKLDIFSAEYDETTDNRPRPLLNSGEDDRAPNPLELMFQNFDDSDDDEDTMSDNSIEDMVNTPLQVASDTNSRTSWHSQGVDRVLVEHTRNVTRSVAATALSLNIHRMCHGALEWFSHPLMERQFQHFYFVWNAPVLKTALAVNMTVAIVILMVVLLEGTFFSPLRKVGSGVLMCSATLGLVGIVFLSSQSTSSLWRNLCSIVILLNSATLLVGAMLMRPSIVVNDVTYIYTLHLAWYHYNSWPSKYHIFFIAAGIMMLFISSEFFTPGVAPFSYSSRLGAQIFVCCGFFSLSIGAKEMHEQRERYTFCDFVISNRARKAAASEEVIRQSILSSTIPPPVHKYFFTSADVSTWGRQVAPRYVRHDWLVLVHVRFDSLTQVVFEVGGEPRNILQPMVGCLKNLVLAVDSANEFCRQVQLSLAEDKGQEQVALLDQQLSHVCVGDAEFEFDEDEAGGVATHSSQRCLKPELAPVSIFRVFGDQAQLAIGLGGDEPFQHCNVLCSMMLLVALEESLHSNTLIAPFSAVVKMGKMLSTLTQSDYPTFELLGPLIFRCKMLLNASPAGSIAVSTTVGATLAAVTGTGSIKVRECTQVQQLLQQIRLGSPQQWSIRGVGHVDVHTVSLRPRVVVA